MIIYIGVLYLILSSIYTFSFAGKIWNENKLASLGAILTLKFTNYN